jgi:acetyl-CoA carboxylase carboxyl transferase subunit beta
LNWIKETVLPKFKAFVKIKEPEEVLWVKCKSCSQMIFHKEFSSNHNVCKTCGYHDHLSARERIEFLLDKDSIENITIPKPKLDPLNFKDKKKYSDRIKDAQSKTKLDDALLVSFGLIDKTPVILACFDFAFMAGSMGRYVGDGLILASEEAIKRKCSLIVVPSSGGARMQEGIFSLMQMPRSTIAINKIKKAKLPYIVLHANPTTGGVTASFAMLGDIHIAEPGAIIGFAGRRVIEETVKEKLPEDFQTAEYLKSHGMIDIVVPRSEQKTTISKLLKSLTFYLN